MRNIGEYHAYLVGIIAASKLTNEWHKLVFKARDRHSGTVRTREDLHLIDNAIIRFTEDVSIQDRQAIRLSYSYHYIKGDYFFRYDKDPDVIRPDHPECHLHANDENVRYPTHDIDFEQFLSFVKAVFYSDR